MTFLLEVSLLIGRGTTQLKSKKVFAWKYGCKISIFQKDLRVSEFITDNLVVDTSYQVKIQIVVFGREASSAQISFTPSEFLDLERYRFGEYGHMFNGILHLIFESYEIGNQSH